MDSRNKQSGKSSFSPLKIVGLPFRAYRDFFGKPLKSEEYKHTFNQRMRLKIILPKLFKGKNLNSSDRAFMDFFNDFITGHGSPPVDQSDTTMKCGYMQDCKPYIFKKRFSVKRKEDTNNTDDKNKTSTPFSRYKITFGKELKLKNGKIFKKDGIYEIKFLREPKKTPNGTEFYVRNTFLDEDDFLILKTDHPTGIDNPLTFQVYQDNLKNPLRTPIDLGKMPLKITKF
jgi:hypothetical protein